MSAVVGNGASCLCWPRKHTVHILHCREQSWLRAPAGLMTLFKKKPRFSWPLQSPKLRAMGTLFRSIPVGFVILLRDDFGSTSLRNLSFLRMVPKTDSSRSSFLPTLFSQGRPLAMYWIVFHFFFLPFNFSYFLPSKYFFYDYPLLETAWKIWMNTSDTESGQGKWGLGTGSLVAW